MIFSIITVSYNASDTIEDTIQSVLQQREQVELEYLVIDGGSTDGTVDIIRRYDDAIDYWVSEPDQGIYDAMNKGIEQASGEWVGILNSDDWYADSALSCVAAAVRTMRDPDAIVGQLVRVTKNMEVGQIVNPPTASFSCRRPNNHPATFVQRSVYEKIGDFDLRYPISADLEFILRAQANPDVRIARCFHPLVFMRMGGVSSGYSGLTEATHIEYEYFGALPAAQVFLTKLFQKTRRLIGQNVLPDALFDRLRKAKWRRDVSSDEFITLDQRKVGLE